MTNKDLSRQPCNLRRISGDGEAWRYEAANGFSVIVPPFIGKTAQFHIPIKMMRDYLRRLDRR